MKPTRTTPPRTTVPAARIVCALALLVGCSHPSVELPVRSSADVAATIAAQRGGFSLLDDSAGKHEFGVVEQGTLCERAFPMVSDGEEPLLIQRIVQNCGCTDAWVQLVDGDERIRLAPGERVDVGRRFELVTRIDTHGRNGAFVANVSLITNRPGGLFLFDLGAEVREEITLDPGAALDFGRIAPTGSKRRELLLTGVDGVPFALEVSRGTPLPEGVSLELAPVTSRGRGAKAAREWTANLELGPGLPVGGWDESVSLVAWFEGFDGKRRPYTLSLSLRAHGVPTVSAQPPFLGLGSFPRDQVQEHEILLEVADGHRIPEDLTVDVLGSGDEPHPLADAFRITAEPLEGGRGVRALLRVEALRETTAGIFAGTLRFQVGHPDVPELRVRFSGFARPGDKS